MLGVDDYLQIRFLHRDGLSIRAIARQLGHGRGTVAKALADGVPRGYTRHAPPASPKLGSSLPALTRFFRTTGRRRPSSGTLPCVSASVCGRSTAMTRSAATCRNTGGGSRRPSCRWRWRQVSAWSATLVIFRWTFPTGLARCRYCSWSGLTATTLMPLSVGISSAPHYCQQQITIARPIHEGTKAEGNGSLLMTASVAAMLPLSGLGQSCTGCGPVCPSKRVAQDGCRRQNHFRGDARVATCWLGGS